jgi:hypothetical protein
VRGGGPRFLNQLVRLVAGLGQDAFALGLGVREFGLDFLGVGETFGDLLPARFQHGENRPVGKSPQHEENEGKTDRLREQNFPLDS